MNITPVDPLSPRQFGWDVDTDAPGFYPRTLVPHRVRIRPDDRDLVATQKQIDPEHGALKAYDRRRAGIVDIVAFGGVRYINDGHNRLAGAQRAGEWRPECGWPQKLLKHELGRHGRRLPRPDTSGQGS